MQVYHNLLNMGSYFSCYKWYWWTIHTQGLLSALILDQIPGRILRSELFNLPQTGGGQFPGWWGGQGCGISQHWVLFLNGAVCSFFFFSFGNEGSAPHRLSCLQVEIHTILGSTLELEWENVLSARDLPPTSQGWLVFDATQIVRWEASVLLAGRAEGSEGGRVVEHPCYVRHYSYAFLCIVSDEPPLPSPTRSPAGPGGEFRCGHARTPQTGAWMQDGFQPHLLSTL